MIGQLELDWARKVGSDREILLVRRIPVPYSLGSVLLRHALLGALMSSITHAFGLSSPSSHHCKYRDDAYNQGGSCGTASYIIAVRSDLRRLSTLTLFYL
jgi:hypothetical protein